MLDQKQMDNMSALTETDFRAIVTAVEGGVDWEFFVMLLEHYYYDQAIRLCKGGWNDAVDRMKDKADKINDFRIKLSRLNA